MRKGLFLIVILLFPSIIYLLFSLGQHNVKKLEFYGSYTISAEGDTIYNPVSLPDLVDASGETISAKTLEGKVIVVDVIDQPCDEGCRTKMATLANYLHKLDMRDRWMLVTISMSNEHPEELSALAGDVANLGENWSIASAMDPAALQSFLDEVFVKTGRANSVEELPSKEFMILDQGGHIRSYFDSRIYKENRKLEDAIKVLIQEPHIEWKE